MLRTFAMNICRGAAVGCRENLAELIYYLCAHVHEQTGNDDDDFSEVMNDPAFEHRVLCVSVFMCVCACRLEEMMTMITVR